MSQILITINKKKPQNPTQEKEKIWTLYHKVTTDQQYPL